jgi:hypothetical protein
MPDLVRAVTDAAIHAGPTQSAQGWFAGGERVGYAPEPAPSLRRKTRPSGFS